MNNLTPKNLESAFQYLEDPQMELPETLKELTELEVLAAKHIRNRALVSEIRNP